MTYAIQLSFLPCRMIHVLISDVAATSPAETGAQFFNHRGMEGSVDLSVSLQTSGSRTLRNDFSGMAATQTR